ncbi:MAG: transcriptional regulator [Acidimicrobiia bacterium]
MIRRAARAIEADARETLLGALASLRVAATAHAADDSFEPGVGSVGADAPNFILVVGGRRIAVEVKSVVTKTEADRSARRFRRRGIPALIVADRIAEDAKTLLRKADINFFDRRGELRIVVPPVIIDTRVPGSTATRASSSDPLPSQVAREAAIACLLTPDQPHGVRGVAGYIDRAPSAVSRAMALLRRAGLLTSKGEAAIPDLFNELLVRWRRTPVALAALPQRGSSRGSAQLELGLAQPEETLGWALTDTVAAAAWGMPVVARGNYPRDFYVPSDAVLRRARALLGEASDADARVCTVAVAPVRLACLHRQFLVGETWPVANHIVVALDIAADRARGSEALDQWHPNGIVRAW